MPIQVLFLSGCVLLRLLHTPSTSTYSAQLLADSRHQQLWQLLFLVHKVLPGGWGPTRISVLRAAGWGEQAAGTFPSQKAKTLQRDFVGGNAPGSPLLSQSSLLPKHMDSSACSDLSHLWAPLEPCCSWGCATGREKPLGLFSTF